MREKIASITFCFFPHSALLIIVLSRDFNFLRPQVPRLLWQWWQLRPVFIATFKFQHPLSFVMPTQQFVLFLYMIWSLKIIAKTVLGRSNTLCCTEFCEDFSRDTIIIPVMFPFVIGVLPHALILWTSLAFPSKKNDRIKVNMKLRLDTVSTENYTVGR